jgi:hypothetical protein
MTLKRFIRGLVAIGVGIGLVQLLRALTDWRWDEWTWGSLWTFVLFVGLMVISYFAMRALFERVGLYDKEKR